MTIKITATPEEMAELTMKLIEGRQAPMSFGVKADDFLEPAPGSKIVPGAAKLEDEVITNRYLRSD